MKKKVKRNETANKEQIFKKKEKPQIGKRRKLKEKKIDKEEEIKEGMIRKYSFPNYMKKGIR